MQKRQRNVRKGFWDIGASKLLLLQTSGKNLATHFYDSSLQIPRPSETVFHHPDDTSRALLPQIILRRFGS
jgi:hypothetical protein